MEQLEFMGMLSESQVKISKQLAEHQKKIFKLEQKVNAGDPADFRDQIAALNA